MTKLQIVWVAVALDPQPAGSSGLIGVYHSEKSAEKAATLAAQCVARGRGISVDPPRIGSSGYVQTNADGLAFAWYLKEVQP